jgi:hypothetical protein
VCRFREDKTSTIGAQVYLHDPSQDIAHSHILARCWCS